MQVSVHVKIDTGMNRLGVPWNDLGSVLEALDSARHLRVAGTFTHLACAEEQDRAFTREQVARFRNALSAIREAGIDPGEIHVANSAGLLYGQDLRSWSVRPGIALYGYPPAPGRCVEGFEPVLSLKTRIGHLCTIEVGRIRRLQPAVHGLTEDARGNTARRLRRRFPAGIGWQVEGDHP